MARSMSSSRNCTFVTRLISRPSPSERERWEAGSKYRVSCRPLVVGEELDSQVRATPFSCHLLDLEPLLHEAPDHHHVGQRVLCREALRVWLEVHDVDGVRVAVEAGQHHGDGRMLPGNAERVRPLEDLRCPGAPQPARQWTVEFELVVGGSQEGQVTRAGEFDGLAMGIVSTT
jgi:hypothetical protein